MSASWTIRRFARITNNISVELTCGPGGFTVEWIGGRPRNLTSAQQERYRRARNALLGEVAERMGGNVLLVEI
jgi:hypothetical protein